MIKVTARTFRFPWLLIMQPMGLHQQLNQAGIPPVISLGYLWRRQQTVGDYGRQLLGFGLFGPAFLVIVAFLLGLWLDGPWTMGAMMVPAILGWLWMLTVAWVNMLWGVIGGTMLTLSLTIALHFSAGTWSPMVILWGGSAALGVAMGIVSAVSHGKGFRLLDLALAGLMPLGLAYGQNIPPEMGLSAVLVGISAYLRLPVYVLEVMGQGLLYGIQCWRGRLTLGLSPVLYHELSFFPHPWLMDHMLRSAEAAPVLVRRVLAQCHVVPGQRWLARLTWERLQIREVVQQIKHAQFALLVELRGEWLDKGTDPPSWLLICRELARDIRVVQGPAELAYRQSHLTHAERMLADFDQRYRKVRSLAPVLRAWGQTIQALRRDIQ